MGGMMDDCLKAEKIEKIEAEKKMSKPAFLRNRKPKKRKVFCSMCRWLDYNKSVKPPVNECIYKDNTFVEIRTTWYKEEVVLERINPPSEINKNNDCKWFEHRPGI